MQWLHMMLYRKTWLLTLSLVGDTLSHKFDQYLMLLKAN